MKCLTCFFIIISLLFNKCYGKEIKKIPDKPDELIIKVERIIKNKNQSELFIYNATNKRICGIIELKKRNSTINNFIRRRKELSDNRNFFINFLNYLNFLELNDKMLNDTSNDQYNTLIRISLKYQYKGKVVTKNVVVKDIDKLIERNRCKEAFQVKQLLLVIDNYLYSIYKYGEDTH